jgi:RNA polymerase sigma-70 factor (ECF subfamily)
LEGHRRELTALCRRELGSACEAEDAVQETLVRAWGRLHQLEDPGALRAWLRRIATNVCHDMRDQPQRRAQPIDVASLPGAACPSPSLAAPAGAQPPAAAGGTGGAPDDPAERAVISEAVTQAFAVALLRLSSRQRSALVLCEVLRWRAGEVAELLGTTVGSVTSALQRARSSLAADGAAPGQGYARVEKARPLARRHVDAFERRDFDALVALLQPDG